MIELQEVTKLYNEGRPNEVAALGGVSLTIARDAVTVLTGPSGSGKTTLLSLVGLMARPTTGRVFLDGEMISGLPERFLTAERRTRFGFVFQRFNLIRGLTVMENVMLPAAPLGEAYGAVRARAQAHCFWPSRWRSRSRAAGATLRRRPPRRARSWAREDRAT